MLLERMISSANSILWPLNVKVDSMKEYAGRVEAKGEEDSSRGEMAG